MPMFRFTTKASTLLVSEKSIWGRNLEARTKEKWSIPKKIVDIFIAQELTGSVNYLNIAF
jgi:hypothetical protein